MGQGRSQEGVRPGLSEVMVGGEECWRHRQGSSREPLFLKGHPGRLDHDPEIRNPNPEMQLHWVPA